MSQWEPLYPEAARDLGCNLYPLISVRGSRLGINRVDWLPPGRFVLILSSVCALPTSHTAHTACSPFPRSYPSTRLFHNCHTTSHQSGTLPSLANAGRWGLLGCHLRAFSAAGLQAPQAPAASAWRCHSGCGALSRSRCAPQTWCSRGCGNTCLECLQASSCSVTGGCCQ